MTVGDWATLVGAISAVVGLVLAGVAWIVRRAVAEVNVSHKVDALAEDFVAHKVDDNAAFAKVDARFDEGDKVMRELNERSIRTDAKVDLLVQWQTGANPETKPS